MSKWIEITPAGKSPSGKTKRWIVNNSHPDHAAPIGVIRWHGAWRKYVFEQPGAVYYDWDCLRMIADFIEAATQEHMSGKS